MTTTPHSGAVLLESSQAQKEITINEALVRLDALLNFGVVDRDLATPPASPGQGAVYIVAASPTGAWSGKAGQLAYFDQVWRFIAPNEGLVVWVNDENRQLVFNGATWQGVTSSDDAGKLAQGRLTLTSNTPVTSSDVAGATTLYYTPFRGNQLALYTGSAWSQVSFSQLSIAVPASTNTNFDVFAYANSGSAALELTAWSNDITRATPLAWQDGVYVKSGAATRRYLGTVRTGNVAGQTHDSEVRRFVWNYYQRLTRSMRAFESMASWTYSAAVWRQANNNSANRLEFVLGVAEEPVSVSVMAAVTNSTATLREANIAIGLDNTTVNSSSYGGVAAGSAIQMPSVSNRFGNLVGYHYLAWLEAGANTDTQTWRGAGLFGITGTLEG